MNNNPVSLPSYTKIAQILVGMVALFYILYIGQDILIPIVFSLLIAILLNPFVIFMEKIGINRIVSILIAIFISIVVTSAILYFIGSQLSLFSESLPLFKEKFDRLLSAVINFFQKNFRLNRLQISEWMEKLRNTGMDSAAPFIHSTLTTVSSVLVVMFLLPVYIFLFLFYKPLLLEFISRLFTGGQQSKVAEVLTETKALIQNYLIGLLVECGLVAILNSVSLLIIGVQYAVLLGVIGALLNMIPYVGGIVGISLPMLIALATKSGTAAFWVFVAYMVVQFIDNNIIVPKIVASRVKINALISIVVVLIGGAVWGISGMFLSIPLTAIVKVVFDRIPALSPFGYLLGDTMPEIGKDFFRKKKKKP